MMLYNKTNKMIPPNLFTQPSSIISTDFCNILPARFTSNTTIRNTAMKDMSGNHFAELLIVVDNLTATVDESFNAAARPTINAMMEKSATINPFLKPFIQASMMSKAKAASISIIIF